MTLEPSAATEWQRLLDLLPPDLETSARRYGAFRRKRQLRSAADLLRLALAYACGNSLDAIVGRAGELGMVEHLCDNVLDRHFAKMVPWISYLLGQQLAGAAATFPWGTPLRVRLLDATTLARPGATGTDWRLHMGLDLRTGLIDYLAVTGANLGEHLADFPLDPGDIALGDRGYATRQGLVAVHRRAAYSLVRLNWHNVPLQHPEGQPFDLLAALRTLEPGQQGEWAVQTAPTAALPAVPGRLVAYALGDKAVATARRNIRHAARKKGHTPTAATLEAAGYVVLFTTVPASLLTAAQVLALYRMRWQIEIVFKRSKSGLKIDDIRATTDAVCYLVLLARCLLLLLLERLAWTTGLFSPPGDAPGADESLPVVPGPLSDAGRECVPAPHAEGMATLAAQYAEALFYGAPPPADLAA